MAEIGLFPLELVLLPGERIPLHIFEDRYKELIGECLSGDGEFGLVLEDESGLREVGTRAGVIELIHEFDDGRMNVVVEGHERFRIVALTGGREFRTARVEPIEDDGEHPTGAEAEEALAVFRRLVAVAEADAVDEPAADSEHLSFELAARVDFGQVLKQELLELRSERVRLRRLAELLDNVTDALALEREARQRAAGNGKVARG